MKSLQDRIDEVKAEFIKDLEAKYKKQIETLIDLGFEKLDNADNGEIAYWRQHSKTSDISLEIIFPVDTPYYEIRGWNYVNEDEILDEQHDNFNTVLMEIKKYDNLKNITGVVKITYDYLSNEDGEGDFLKFVQDTRDYVARYGVPGSWMDVEVENDN